MERQWLTLDQIKAEYASNDYNPELLLQHLLHHVEASPASVPEVTDGMAIAFHNALTDGSIGQSEVDEIKTGLRAAIASAPTPPVSEDRWQPIETAPKYGRELILILTPSGFPQVTYSNTWWIGGFSVECKPTHWMPLPKAPEMEGK